MFAMNPLPAILFYSELFIIVVSFISNINIIQLDDDARTALRVVKSMKGSAQNNGFVSWYLNARSVGGIGNSQVRSIINRVRRHLIGGDPLQVIAFKRSFTETFTMIGVAGAIISQIAFTGLSLRDINEVHWTAYSAFIVSLIAGCLSVFFSCMMQLRLSGLHTPEELLNWLTKPNFRNQDDKEWPNIFLSKRMNRALSQSINRVLSNRTNLSELIDRTIAVRMNHSESQDNESDNTRQSNNNQNSRWKRWLNAFFSIMDFIYGSMYGINMGSWTRDILIRQGILPNDMLPNDVLPNDEASHQRNLHQTPSVLEQVPSVNAALMLSAPARLLTTSLAAFFVGLGLYLGFLFSRNLGRFRDNNAALANMLFYIIFTVLFLVWFGYPTGMKSLENRVTRKWLADKKPSNWTISQSSGDVVGTEEYGTDDIVLDTLHPDGRDVQEERISSDVESQNVMEALEEVIKTQERQLQAQRALLQSMRRSSS